MLRTALFLMGAGLILWGASQVLVSRATPDVESGFFGPTLYYVLIFAGVIFLLAGFRVNRLSKEVAGEDGKPRKS